jgi:hypothetical protein
MGADEQERNPWLSQVVGGRNNKWVLLENYSYGLAGSRTMMMIPKKNHQQSVCERDASV